MEAAVVLTDLSQFSEECSAAAELLVVAGGPPPRQLEAAGVT